MKNYICGVVATICMCALAEMAYRKGRADGVKWCKTLLDVAYGAANTVKKNEEEA